MVGYRNLKRISDFSLISNLRNLVGLGINGSMWTTQRIDSLAPLSKLTKLRYLSLVNTRATDKSLVPLYSLDNLQTLQMAKWWPRAEVEELKRVNPRLRGI